MGFPIFCRERPPRDRDQGCYRTYVAVLIVAVLAFNVTANESDPCGEAASWVFETGLQTFDTTEGRVCSISVAVITSTPVVHTSPRFELPGGGDFRAAGVVAIEVEAMTSKAEPGSCGLPLTLVLRSDGGTAADFTDDDLAFLWDDYEGLWIAPCAGEGWLTFRFEIPSDVVSVLPDGWTGGHQADPLAFRSGVGWDDVITNVDRIELWWGAPSLDNPPRTWVVAVDGIEIQTDGPTGLQGDAPASTVPGSESGLSATTWDQRPIALQTH